MATLSVGDLSLEIAYSEFKFGWVHYDIWFRWRDEPIISDVVLRRGPDWLKRKPVAIHACEHRGCGALPLLRRLLKNDKPDYWEPMEPDVVLAVYPMQRFPFLPSNFEVTYVSPEIEAWSDELKANRRRRMHNGPVPEDRVELILFVDTRNFGRASAYSGDGVCLRMTATRGQLQDFYDRLRAEYVAFRERHQVDRLNAEELGDEYQGEWF